MGAHSATTSSPSLPGGGAVAATGLAVLGMVTGAGVAFAGDAPHAGSAEDTAGSSECSVGGTPAGGSGTGSPDGVITNGQCSAEQIRQAQHHADTDGDPSTRGSVDSPADDTAEDGDTAGGDPNVVGGTGDGVSSQSGTAQKVDGAETNPGASSQRPTGDDPEPALAGVL